MVPLELLSLEEDVGYDAEHNEGDDFLYDFQLHQREGSAVFDEADAVGRHKETVLDAGDAPREEYHGVERPVGRDAGLVELQVAVPCKRHKDVAAE